MPVVLCLLPALTPLHHPDPGPQAGQLGWVYFEKVP